MMIGFKRSVRGNIRQSPNVITWITTLQNLKKWGADRPAKCDGIRNLALAHFVFEGSPNHTPTNDERPHHVGDTENQIGHCGGWAERASICCTYTLLSGEAPTRQGLLSLWAPACNQFRGPNMWPSQGGSEAATSKLVLRLESK